MVQQSQSALEAYRRTGSGITRDRVRKVFECISFGIEIMNIGCGMVRWITRSLEL
ncbi:MAG: hypothetical protein HWQ41_01925 [Nostoc sp. NOS(2021)]|uniref:hypothetical protein n=1 Tax=Nostoc sp. NOS(2021) TaxID=2815407 RepID=UPI0025D99275|nr:hypothetical protein [Nostoc sp. NOS(2021)]MBN3894087.1 hypothetical protein [Nostoc sp. NOS(2021)]